MNMRVKIDLPQNHRKELDGEILSQVSECIEDLLTNWSGDKTDPTSWTMEVSNDGIEVHRVEPSIPPKLRLVTTH